MTGTVLEVSVNLSPEQVEAIAQRTAELLRGEATKASGEPLAGLPALLTVAELAEGARVSERTIMRAIQGERLAATRPGGRYRITRKEALRWLASR